MGGTRSTRGGQERNRYGIMVENLKKSSHLEDTVLYRRIILK